MNHQSKSNLVNQTSSRLIEFHQTLSISYQLTELGTTHLAPACFKCLIVIAICLLLKKMIFDIP